MRSETWDAMLRDLGMKKEIDKEGFLRVAYDIQTHKNIDELAAGIRGRNLLRYIKENDRTSTMFDHELSRKISKIAFVPVQFPVKVIGNGNVLYESRVLNFEQTIAKSNGALAFTVTPIIDEDIIPDQIFASALGIMYMPKTDIVLKHLNNLIKNGDTLDRWNSSLYKIEEAFDAIFSFLSDHWREINSNIQQSLCSSNIIPIKQLLVKPSRIFFRLSEDLNPFMHELPR